MHNVFLSFYIRKIILTFYIRIVEKVYRKTCYILRCLSRVQQYFCRASYVFKTFLVSEKFTSQIYGFQYYLPHLVTKNDGLLFQFKAVKKQSSTLSIPFVGENRGDDERSCTGTAVHASGTSRSLLSPFVPASAMRTRREKYTTIESRQNTRGKTTNKTVHTASKHFSLVRKVMVHCDRPRSTCFCAGLKSSLVAVGQLSVSQTPRERRLVLLKLSIRRCCLLRCLI